MKLRCLMLVIKKSVDIGDKKLREIALRKMASLEQSDELKMAPVLREVQMDARFAMAYIPRGGVRDPRSTRNGTNHSALVHRNV